MWLDPNFTNKNLLFIEIHFYFSLKDHYSCLVEINDYFRFLSVTFCEIRGLGTAAKMNRCFAWECTMVLGLSSVGPFSIRSVVGAPIFFELTSAALGRVEKNSDLIFVLPKSNVTRHHHLRLHDSSSSDNLSTDS